MDRLELIQMLFGAFPTANATASTFTAYLDTLEEIPLDELRVIVRQCMREGGAFPPSAGQVMQRWLAAYAPPALGAEQAWLSVQMAMRDPRNYVPEPSPFVPKFKDPVVGKVVAAMGWYNLRMSEQPRVDQAQFIRMYDAFVDSAASEQKLSTEYVQLREANRLAVNTSDGTVQHTHERQENGNGIVKRISA